jgi:hypothetical protein
MKRCGKSTFAILSKKNLICIFMVLLKDEVPFVNNMIDLKAAEDPAFKELHQAHLNGKLSKEQEEVWKAAYQEIVQSVKASMPDDGVVY